MAEGEDFNPNPPRSWLDYVPVAALIALPVILGAVMYHQQQRPDVLPEMVGCYVGSPPLQDEIVVIEPTGIFRTKETDAPIKITVDKEGLSITQTSSGTAFKGRIIDSSQLLRISEDRRSFIIPFGDTKATFSRVACSGAASGTAS